MCVCTVYTYIYICTWIHKVDIINLLEKIKHELSELKKKVEIVLDY